MQWEFKGSESAEGMNINMAYICATDCPHSDVAFQAQWLHQCISY